MALPIVEATTAEELDTAFASAAAQLADAIIVFGDPLTTSQASASCRARSEASSARDVSLSTIRQWRIGRLRP